MRTKTLKEQALYEFGSQMQFILEDTVMEKLVRQTFDYDLFDEVTAPLSHCKALLSYMEGKVGVPIVDIIHTVLTELKVMGVGIADDLKRIFGTGEAVLLSEDEIVGFVEKHREALTETIRKHLVKNAISELSGKILGLIKADPKVAEAAKAIRWSPDRFYESVKDGLISVDYSDDQIDWLDADAVLEFLENKVRRWAQLNQTAFVPELWTPIKDLIRNILVTEIYPKANATAPSLCNRVLKTVAANIQQFLEDAMTPKKAIDTLNEIEDAVDEAVNAIVGGDINDAIRILIEAHKTANTLIGELAPFLQQNRRLKNYMEMMADGIWYILGVLSEYEEGEAQIQPQVRDELSQYYKDALERAQFTYRRRKFTVSEILEITKREIRGVLGGAAVAFVVPYGDISRAVWGYEDTVKRWLVGDKGALTHFLSSIYGDWYAQVAASILFHDPELVQEEADERLRPLKSALAEMKAKIEEKFYPKVGEIIAEVSSAVADKVAQIMAAPNIPSDQKRAEINRTIQEAVKPKIRELDETLMEVLAEITETFYERLGARKISIKDALAYWRGRREFINNIATTIGRVVQGALTVGYGKRQWLVYYISTDLEDYLTLGTSADANENSCFWTFAGIHSIPSILVGRNVAVCYVFIYDDERNLERVGGKPVNVGETYKFTPAESLWQHGRLVGRTLILVDHTGRLVKSEHGNTYVDPHYTAVSNLIWSTLRSILRSEFAGVKINPTNWYYRSPSP